MNFKKSLLAITLALLLVLTGCGSKPAVTEPDTEPTPAQETEPANTGKLNINFENGSSYIFNEIYISPTAANDWGDDLLGSTSILKMNGTIQVSVSSYDYNNYDIWVVDEDRYNYYFYRVPLEDNSLLSISFNSGALTADVYDKNQTLVSTVTGELQGGEQESATAATTVKFTLINEDSTFRFDELYIMPEGTTDKADMGYNHIAYITGGLKSGKTASIEADNFVYFDLLFIDEDDDGWYYQSIYIENGCDVSVYFDNGASLSIWYPNNTVKVFSGSVI